MPKLEVSITKEQMDDIREDCRKEFEREWSYDKLMEFLKNTQSISLQEYLWKYGIYARYEALKGKKIEDLNSHERFVVATYWMMYESFGRR